ncbi:hypothetical protein [Lysobacter sp. Root690]|uniref:hypothetical protein n=1 Tax=Lysobacter sp. Root690 TaxID=1736588 RepID=UPI0006FDE520|nr:hypothetical protein [Lysobacter sp. Root690]KRB07973.1 hypothetical protein ASD86_09230 [Lysobacter sp. Root690]
MGESIFNIYLYFDPSGRCDYAGYVAHLYEGNDEQGIEFLRKKVKADLQRATKLRLSNSFTQHEYSTRCRLGSERDLYAEVLALAGADYAALAVVTPVQNGQVRYSYSSQTNSFDVEDAVEAAGEHGQMVDWLRKYTRDGCIHFSELIHDDYFVAIKLTYNNKLYVSSMKLMLSCIDSLAYVEYGDVREPPSFVRWLNDYADLTPLGITAEELWELRNGLLHMTNINSSNVRKKNVRRISFRVGHSEMALPDTGGVFFFEFRGLINVFAHAQARWIESYGVNREKFEKFVERYDETVSDGRLAYVQIPQA